MGNDNKNEYSRRQRIGLWMGPALFIALLILPPPGDLGPEAWRVAALGLLMATWWISEAIPIPATGLLPIVALPLLGVSTIGQATAAYANPLIYLFLGGFMIALAMQRWHLHRRIALAIIAFVGTSPSRIVLGFMIAAAFLSLWVSNTATALMMLPIALSVLSLDEPRATTDLGPESLDGPLRNFGIALALGIAYACNIGGLGTLIGTPPNALMAGYMLETHGVEIGFGQWMLFGMPLVIVGIPLAWLILTRLCFPISIRQLPGGRNVIAEERSQLGRMSPAEFRVALVFTATAALWIFRPLLDSLLPGLSDAGIAIAAAIALFLIPSGQGRGSFLMDWDHVKELPWGILILFGGGLSLASAVTQSGLDQAIGQIVLGFEHWPTLLLLALTVVTIILLTEMTSNTATAAAFLPILAAGAIGLGQDPLLFVIPAAVAASCAFMLPVATPPNAIVYGSGLLTIPMMVKAGIWLNAFFVLLIMIAAYSMIAIVFGV